MSTLHSSQSLDDSCDQLVAEMRQSLPNADICERLALNRLRQARARQRELAQMTDEIHPAASADAEIRRAYAAAERDFWRALRYLQRRLDHRARLAERKANPTDAYAATLFQSDPEPASAQTVAAVPADADKLRPTNPNKPLIDLPIQTPNTTFIPITIVPANKPLTPTAPADCDAFDGLLAECAQAAR